LQRRSTGGNGWAGLGDGEVVDFELWGIEYLKDFVVGVAVIVHGRGACQPKGGAVGKGFQGVHHWLSS
jgi:hypothetical protein